MGGGVKLFPFAQIGANIHSGGADFATDLGMAIGKEVEKGAFQAIFSLNPNFSTVGSDKRVGATGSISGMLFFPMILTAGAGANYNIDQKQVEPTLDLGPRTLIPIPKIGGVDGVFGGLAVNIPDLTQVRQDGVSVMFSVVGDFSAI